MAAGQLVRNCSEVWQRWVLLVSASLPGILLQKVGAARHLVCCQSGPAGSTTSDCQLGVVSPRGLCGRGKDDVSNELKISRGAGHCGLKPLVWRLAGGRVLPGRSLASAVHSWESCQ